MAIIPALSQLDLGINQGNFTLPAGLKKYEERQCELERCRKAAERRVQWAKVDRCHQTELHLLSAADLHTKVPAESVDCVITDPPYEKAGFALLYRFG